jgi:hypothetical protein
MLELGSDIRRPQTFLSRILELFRARANSVISITILICETCRRGPDLTGRIDSRITPRNARHVLVFGHADYSNSEDTKSLAVS